MVITQIEPITVIFTLAEDQIPPIMQRMHAGARLKVDAYDRDMKMKIAEGWLETIDNQIDPTTGTVKLRANFDNRTGSLFPNQFVNARLLVEEKHGVTLIPTAAVQRNSQATYIWLVKPDSSVTVRTITTGTQEGDDTEVTSGLVPGDEVVMTGVDRLQEGSKVQDAKIRGGGVPKEIHEPVTDLYPPADRDVAAHGGHSAGGRGRIQTVAGFRAAGGGLSHHSGHHLLSRRQPGCDGVFGHCSLGAPVRPGAGPPADDLDELERQLDHHLAV